MQVSPCIACDEVSGIEASVGGVIYQDEWWFVSQNKSSVVSGNLILKTKRHVEHLGELSRSEAAGLGELIRKVCLALTRVVKPAKVYVASYGEEVKHVHFFITPRMTHMPSGNMTMFFYGRALRALVRLRIRPAPSSDDIDMISARLREGLALGDA